jgi:hypothetical protein
MDGNSQVLYIDYDNNAPFPVSNLISSGYCVRKAKDNAEALPLARSSEVIILVASERRRECVKLMEHVRAAVDSTINFIVILSSQEDKAFIDRIDPLTFQYFTKDRYAPIDLTKAISNAIEMRQLKVREKMFVKDLDRIEDELKKVEHRLYTISTIKRLNNNDAAFLN